MQLVAGLTDVETEFVAEVEPPRFPDNPVDELLVGHVLPKTGGADFVEEVHEFTFGRLDGVVHGYSPVSGFVTGDSYLLQSGRAAEFTPGGLEPDRQPSRVTDYQVCLVGEHFRPRAKATWVQHLDARWSKLMVSEWIAYTMSGEAIERGPQIERKVLVLGRNP